MSQEPTSKSAARQRARNLAGQRFGRLMVLEKSDRPYSWLCICDCGSKKTILQKNLIRELTRSCGCLRREMVAERRKSHGLTETVEYGTWGRIKDRCCNPNHPKYARYGGRGIKVCDQWINSFENFLADMGKRPSPEHSIDRIDNDGNYCPDNCRWATREQQGRNKRNNHSLIYQGKALTLAECVEMTGLSRGAIDSRVKQGWSAEEIFAVPKLPPGGAKIPNGSDKRGYT